MDYSALWLGNGMPILWHDSENAHECEEINKRYIGAEAKEDEKVKPVFTLKIHVNDVTCIDFSGRNLLATGSSDKTVRVLKWLPGDSFTEVTYSPLKGHKYGINCVSFSPFGTKLASSSTDGRTFIWDLKRGERIVALQAPGESAGVRTCTFSPNSALLATGGDGNTASLWDVSTLTHIRNQTPIESFLIREIGGHDSTVTSVAFTPDVSYLATGTSYGDLKLWDSMYGHAFPLATRVEVHDLGITCLHFNPSLGKEGMKYLLASGGQDTDLHLWMVSVGAHGRSEPSTRNSIDLHSTLCGHKAPIMSIRFSPNGTLLASASGDKTVRLWDAVTLIPLAVLEAHKRYVTSCAFSEDDELIGAGGGDRCIHVWRVKDILQQPASASHLTPYNRKLLNKFPSQKFRENKKLVNWSLTDVSEWLGEQGLAEYAPNFISHRIDGREMVTLTDSLLESKLGVDALGHRNKILRFVRRFARENADPVGPDNHPKEFLCPITQEIMKDPVLCSDGFSYERNAMEAWLASGKRSSPMTNEKLSHLLLTPNRTLKNLIQRYHEENA